MVPGSVLLACPLSALSQPPEPCSQPTFLRNIQPAILLETTKSEFEGQTHRARGSEKFNPFRLTPAFSSLIHSTKYLSIEWFFLGLRRPGFQT